MSEDANKTLEETVYDLERDQRLPIGQRIAKVLTASLVGVVAERMTEKLISNILEKRAASATQVAESD